MEIKALVAELEGIRTKASAIVKEHEGKTLPPEKRTELDAMLVRAGELQGQIEETKQDDRRSADVDKLTNYLNDPVYKIPRGVGDGELDTKAALTAAGWEIKGGIIHAPHSLVGSTMRLANGETKQIGPAPMWPEEVLFGELPKDDHDARQFFQLTRTAFNPEYRKAYLKWLRNIKAKSESMAMALLEPHEQKALAEGLDTTGGYVVPPDVQAEILARLPLEAVMRANCRVVPTSRDRISFPRIQPNSSSTANGSIYTSGFVGDWAGETPAFADTDPALGLFEIPIKKVRVATKVSNDLLSDAVVNILAFLASDGAVNMGLVEDLGFINGNGSALQPLGLFQHGITTVDIEGSTVDTISNTISNMGSAPKLIDMSYQLPTQYQARARWLAHRLSEAKIRKLVDAVGRWLWGTGLVGEGYVGQPDMFQGKPILRSDFVPQDGTNGNTPIAYGDFSAYIIGQRAAITSTVLRERFADTDQTGIILWERVGGGLWNLDSFRLGQV